MALDPEGGIVMLDGDEKTVRVFDEAGKVLRTVAPRGTGLASCSSRRTWPWTPSATSTWPTRASVYVFSPAGAAARLDHRCRDAQARWR